MGLILTISKRTVPRSATRRPYQLVDCDTDTRVKLYIHAESTNDKQTDVLSQVIGVTLIFYKVTNVHTTNIFRTSLVIAPTSLSCS